MTASLQPRSLLLLAATATQVVADKYAVLVAGSSGFDNYRHQADIAHAYNILTAGGVPPDNIITFMFDDIADSRHNKLKGKLFNRAGDNVPDVYAAVKDHIDYRKFEVSPRNFLNVLTGNAGLGRKRVLTSGPDDDVFVYFADHGGTGFLAFPEFLGLPALLHADKLNEALKTMHEKKMYKSLVFYVEACEVASDPCLSDFELLHSCTFTTKYPH